MRYSRHLYHALLQNRAALIVAIVLWIIHFAPGQCEACKYSVRDVAFVELQSSPYQIRVRLPGAISDSSTELIEKRAAAATSDSNVSWKMVHSALLQGDKPGTDESADKSNGSITLVDSTGRQLILEPAGNVEQLIQAIDSAVESPLREELLTHLLPAHSILLVVEGDDAGANARAREIALGSASDIKSTLASLPKRISYPPEVITLKKSERTEENVFLWSLGIDPEDRSNTFLVVLHGRMRRFGPVLSVPGTSKTELTASLSVIGQDCECDLDRSWMEGPMAPHRWDGSLQQDSVDELGFDPGDPLVIAEMRRILSRGPQRSLKRNALTSSLGDPSLGNPLLTYEEFSIDGNLLSSSPETGNDSSSGATEEVITHEVISEPSDTTITLPVDHHTDNSPGSGSGTSPESSPGQSVAVLEPPLIDQVDSLDGPIDSSDSMLAKSVLFTLLGIFGFAGVACTVAIFLKWGGRHS